MDQKLALYGGRPVRETVLSYGAQWVTDQDIEEVMAVMRSPFLTQGPKVQEFEARVANYVGVKYAVAFCNGTAALHGAMFAAGITEGDEVITTPLTFAATSNSVLYQGGTPVFADVDRNTFLLDRDEVKRKITNRTRAIVAVDFTGQPVNMHAFRELADEHNLVFIQDGAHSLGASLKGAKVGTIADMTMFSFHPVKPITTAEGGVIVTDNEEYYERLLRFRSHGITRDERFMVRESEGPWYYDMIELGYNYRLTDVQAALGVAQMSKLDEFIERRNQIARIYQEAFAAYEDQGLIHRPIVHPDAVSGWHLYILQFCTDRFSTGRREIFEALRAENIGVNVHYIPVYKLHYYERLGYETGLCPIAEELYHSFVTLPLFPKMTNTDVENVIEAVEKVLTYYQM